MLRLDHRLQSLAQRLDRLALRLSRPSDLIARQQRLLGLLAQRAAAAPRRRVELQAQRLAHLGERLARAEREVVLRQRSRLDDLLAAHDHAFAAVEVLAQHSDLATVPDDADLADLDLHGFAADAASELFAAAGEAPGETQTEARDALRLLHRLVGTPR